MNTSKSLSSSESCLMARRRCRGSILTFSPPRPLASLARIPASSQISAVSYSSTAARYTGAKTPILAAQGPFLSRRWTRPTGKWRPARTDRLLLVRTVV